MSNKKNMVGRCNLWAASSVESCASSAAAATEEYPLDLPLGSEDTLKNAPKATLGLAVTMKSNENLIYKVLTFITKVKADLRTFVPRSFIVGFVALWEESIIINE